MAPAISIKTRRHLTPQQHQQTDTLALLLSFGVQCLISANNKTGKEEREREEINLHQHPISMCWRGKPYQIPLFYLTLKPFFGGLITPEGVRDYSRHVPFLL